jgi:TRAP-type C4-dicarboxylate transport system permease large subunit
MDPLHMMVLLGAFVALLALVSSATTSLVIPPSNILIVYALASGGVSIAALFVAGYLPGLVVGLALMAVAGFIARRRRYPVDARVGFGETMRRFLAAIPSLFLVVLVMGGIVAGTFTPITEVSRALVPLYSAMIGALLLVTFLPELSLFLPRWLGM